MRAKSGVFGGWEQEMLQELREMVEDQAFVVSQACDEDRCGECEAKSAAECWCGCHEQDES